VEVIAVGYKTDWKPEKIVCKKGHSGISRAVFHKSIKSTGEYSANIGNEAQRLFLEEAQYISKQLTTFDPSSALKTDTSDEGGPNSVRLQGLEVIEMHIPRG